MPPRGTTIHVNGDGIAEIYKAPTPFAWRIPLSLLTVSGVIAGYIDDPSHFTERQSYLFA